MWQLSRSNNTRKAPTQPPRNRKTATTCLFASEIYVVRLCSIIDKNVLFRSRSIWIGSLSVKRSLATGQDIDCIYVIVIYFDYFRLKSICTHIAVKPARIPDLC
jgi:hypothetical protein